MLGDLGQRLDAVLVFEVDDEELVKRLTARGRSDDTEETIRHRQEVYRSETEPLIEHYSDIAVRGRRRRVGRGDHRPGHGRARRRARRLIWATTRRPITEVVTGSAGVGGIADRVRGRFVEMKTPGQIEAMRAAGLVVAAALAAVTDAAAPGPAPPTSTRRRGHIREAGAVPVVPGYQGFPASICASVNEQVVHGIPSPGDGARRR